MYETVLHRDLPRRGLQVERHCLITFEVEGLLINFGAPTLKEGLHRIVNTLPPGASPHLQINHPCGPGSKPPRPAYATVSAAVHPGH